MMIKPPDRLDDDERNLWDETLRQLALTGIELTDADINILEQYVVSLNNVHYLTREVKTKGSTQVDERGITRTNPAWGQLRDARAFSYKLAKDLGLTPSSKRRTSKLEPIVQDDDGLR